MKSRCYPKRVNPKTMITHFHEIFKPAVLKETSLRNLLLVTIAVAVAKTFRINEIASRLPIDVKTEKSKQKRLLRFLEMPLPLEVLKQAWFGFVLRCLWATKQYQHPLILIDETDLPGGWKAIVAAVTFRNRAIPVFWLIYSNEQIQNNEYRSHNQNIQDFCLSVHQLTLAHAPKHGQTPVLVFDRGFARAKYVIEYLKANLIDFILRVCRNVGVYVNGSRKKLDDLENGDYPDVLYRTTYRIQLHLYVVRDKAFKDPMYLISNLFIGQQIHHCYKRRMQIEHGFRDIKSTFGFRNLVLKKANQSRIELLFFIAVLAYGLCFLSYEKSAARWAKAIDAKRKIYAVIRVIKRVLCDVWTQQFLRTFFRKYLCNADTCL